MTSDNQEYHGENHSNNLSDVYDTVETRPNITVRPRETPCPPRVVETKAKDLQYRDGGYMTDKCDELGSAARITHTAESDYGIVSRGMIHLVGKKEEYLSVLPCVRMNTSICEPHEFRILSSILLSNTDLKMVPPLDSSNQHMPEQYFDYVNARHPPGMLDTTFEEEICRMYNLPYTGNSSLGIIENQNDPNFNQQIAGVDRPVDGDQGEHSRQEESGFQQDQIYQGGSNDNNNNNNDNNNNNNDNNNNNNDNNNNNNNNAGYGVVQDINYQQFEQQANNQQMMVTSSVNDDNFNTVEMDSNVDNDNNVAMPPTNCPDYEVVNYEASIPNMQMQIKSAQPAPPLPEFHGTPYCNPLNYQIHQTESVNNYYNNINNNTTRGSPQQTGDNNNDTTNNNNINIQHIQPPNEPAQPVHYFQTLPPIPSSQIHTTLVQNPVGEAPITSFLPDTPASVAQTKISSLVERLSNIKESLFDPAVCPVSYNWYFLDSDRMSRGPMTTLMMTELWEMNFFQPQSEIRRHDEAGFTPFLDGQRILEVALKLLDYECRKRFSSRKRRRGGPRSFGGDRMRQRTEPPRSRGFSSGLRGEFRGGYRGGFRGGREW